MWFDDKTPDGRFYCRQCGVRGNSAEKFEFYMQQLDKDGFKPKQYVAKTFKPYSQSPRYRIRAQQNAKPVPITDKHYINLVEGAKRYLDVWKLPVTYLANRGICLATAEHFGLGFFHKNHGYRSIADPCGKIFNTPIGICIPNYRGDSLCNIRVRVLGPGESSRKYQVLSGCHPVPLIIHGSDRKNLPVLIVESDLDAMLLWQENRDRFRAYVALGSATVQPYDPDVLELTSSSPKVFFIADNDDAGLNAYETWHRFDNKIQLALLPQGKDPSEAWQMGVDLAAWCMKLRTRGVPEKEKEPLRKTVSLSSHEELCSYIASASSVIGVDYDPIEDMLSLSDGTTDATGIVSNLVSNLAIDWVNDFAGHELVCYDPTLLHRDLPSCSVKLDSLLYLYHAMTGKGCGTSLEDLSVMHFGRRDADLATMVKLYGIYKEKLDNSSHPHINHYKILRGAQLSVAQMMQYGILLDVEKYKSISTDSKVDYSPFAQEDGRVRSYITLLDTVTGRFSCKTPALYSVPNAQKSAFLPAEGHVFVDADFKCCELRIAAHMSNDQKLIDMLTSGADVHREVMKLLLGKQEISDTERKAGKIINISYLYGQTESGMQARLKEAGIEVDADTIHCLYERYKQTFAQLTNWRNTQCNNLRFATDKWGVYTAMKRFIPVIPYGYNWQSKALNYIIQGTGADVLLYALTVLPRNLEGLDAKILLSIHDEILLEVPEANAKAASDALVDAMTEAFKMVVRTDRLEYLVDVHIGTNWLEAKEGK